MSYGPEFAQILKQTRAALGRSQRIGPLVGLGRGVLASWEQQRRVPLIENLLIFSNKLTTEYPDAPIPSQAQFLAAWFECQGLEISEPLLAALRDAGPSRVSLGDLSWLKAYVFTGERREEQARTRLDCLVAPAAASDLRWLPGLRLDPATELIPDKELTSRPWDHLVAAYGDRDIVSISSGAVNAMTGLLIADTVFRFDVQAEARQAYRAFVRDMAHLEKESSLVFLRRLLAAAARLGSSEDPDALLAEAGLGPDAREVAGDVATLLGGLTPAQFTSLFREGVVDPLLRSRYQHERADYAVISFARHPFGSPDRLALVVAGTNGTATSGALRLLATRGITDRPLGAVVRVREIDGQPEAEVVTPPYEPAGIVSSIDKILDGGTGAGRRTTLRGVFGHWTDEELSEWKGLVTSLGDLLAKRAA